MPCYDPPGAYDGVVEQVQRERIDELTSMLCSICRRLPPDFLKFDTKLDAWWKNHEAFDKRRGAL